MDYYDKLDAEVEAISYDQMIESGEFTKEQVEQLKAVNLQVDKLIESMPEMATEGEWEKLEEQIEELYNKIDF